MITQELEENINFTYADAKRRRLETVTVEHLVLVLIDNSSVRRCLTACSADIDSLRQDLEHFIESQVPHVEDITHRPIPTDDFHRIIKRAVNQTRTSLRGKASGAHVLAAVFAEPNCRAAYYLQKHGVERLALLAFANRQKIATDTAEKTTTIEQNLSAQAAAGTLEQPFGRHAEIAEITRILGRKYKNNPLLVGAPGVGKTAAVHQLAHAAVAADAPPGLANLSLFAVSVGDLVAGTKYRGDFEQRIRQLTEKCRACDNAILFIDEIHTLIGAGAVSGGSLDAANIMKPLLSSGIRCIGATTFTEYRRIFEKDAALSRRFHKIDINEPPDDELNMILSGIVTRLSTHHKIEYTPNAVGAAIKYSRRYLPGRFLPDKAIDLLDDAGSRKHGQQNSPPIDESDILEAATIAAGVTNIAQPDLPALEENLSARVIAQPEAASRLAAAVLRKQLGYHEGGRTAGAFLFAGPTGVGKTEMARQLADLLGVTLLRYDMSEYMEAHAVSRLIGAPPGYVGFDQSGRLAEEIVQKPDSIVLLDEIEKAHPEVRNIFLQIMDHGVLTDNSGRHIDFTNAMLIMTSNAGAEEWERMPMGFTRTESDLSAAGGEALRRQFSPEFRNRLDAIVRFMPLPKDAVQQILRRRLRQIAARLKSEKNIKVSFGRRFQATLLSSGFSLTMGARPLERVLRERIMDTLARAEASGQIIKGGDYYLEEDKKSTPKNKKLILA